MNTNPEAILQYVQVLSDQLTKSPDLESALDFSLNYILEVMGRERGALIVHSFHDPAPMLIVKRNLTRQWQVQLDDKFSELRDIAYTIQKDGSEIITEPGLSLAAAHPLVTRSTRQGALLLYGQPCQEEELFLLDHITRVIARRILQDQIERKSRRPNEELAAILMTSTLTNKGLKPHQLQTRLMRSIYRFFRVEHGALILLDEEDEDLAIVKTLRNDAEWNYQVYLKHRKSLINQCIETGDTIVVNEVEEHPSFNPDVDVIKDTTVTSMLCCPLKIDEDIQGVLALYNKQDGHFDGYDQKLVSTISKLISYIIYDIELVQRLKIASAELEVSRWQLLQSRNTLRALFDNIPLAMYIIDTRYQLEAINLSRSQRAQEEPQELVGMKCYQALYDREQPCSFCMVEQTLLAGKDTHQVFQRKGDGHIPQVWEMSTYPNFSDDGKVRQAIIIEEEVTERKRLEEQLIQSEKLAVVGQLAAGVAHEINNPLTAIVANTQLLQQDIQDQDIQEALELIEFAGARAAKVVENLLNLARKDQYEFERADINELIEESLALLKHEINAHGIKLNYQPGEDLPLLNISKEQIKGVWTNLILNGIDAQKDQRTGEIRIQTNADDSFVYVSIEDQGQGIPQDEIKRIFEPFYTTKVSGEGTGLGLTICQRVVKQHGGHIMVESELEEGTKFTVQLPYLD